MSKKTINIRSEKMGGLFDDFLFSSEIYLRLMYPDWININTFGFCEDEKQLLKKELLINNTDYLKKYYKKVKKKELSIDDINQIQFSFSRASTRRKMEMEVPLREHLSKGRLFILSKFAAFKGKKSVVRNATCVRNAFISNHVSTDVFNCVRYNEVLQDPLYWLDLTVEQFINLEEDLERLIAATKRANEIGAGNEGYDEQLEIRQEIMQKIGFIK